MANIRAAMKAAASLPSSSGSNVFDARCAPFSSNKRAKSAPRARPPLPSSSPSLGTSSQGLQSLGERDGLCGTTMPNRRSSCPSQRSELTTGDDVGLFEPIPAYEMPHPPSFYCPISRQCMHDPVVLGDGHTYERRHIEKWLLDHDTSPVSGAKLLHKQVISNHSLRNAIEEYFEEVLGSHRQAIKKAIAGVQKRGGFRSNATLLHTIDSLMQCSVLITADLSLERALAKIMKEAKYLVGAEVASVFLVDHQSHELYSTVNSTGGELRIPMDSGVVGAVVCSGVPLMIPDAYNDNRFNTAVDLKTGFRTRSILCVPIRAGKSGIIGAAQLINKTNTGILVPDGDDCKCMSNKLEFTVDDQQFLEVLAAQAGVAVMTSGMFESVRGVSSDHRCQASEASGHSRTLLPHPAVLHRAAEDSIEVQEFKQTSHIAAAQEEGGLSPKKFSLVKPILAASVDSWEIDTLSLAELTDNKPLSTLGMHLFDHHGLPSFFNMDRKKLEKFLLVIEQGYPVTNPYHNRAHAASVLHSMHSLLSHGLVADATLLAVGSDECKVLQKKVVILAGLLSAVVHDYEHEGVNNDFLVKTASEKAMNYNDKSPNENHHVAAAWRVLRRPECNFLESFAVEELRQLRRLLIDLVLATDMAEHGKLLTQFKERLGSTAAQTSEVSISAANSFVATSPQDALIGLQLALKCADLGHLSLCWSSHCRWVRLLEEEFFCQGDREGELGMPEASFLMDRKKPGASETQVGFFDFVVLPLFRALTSAFPGALPMLSGVEANYQRWKDIQLEAQDDAP